MTRLFHDFLVRWVQQLHWPSSSLTDVKDSFTQAVCERASYFICHYWQTELFPQLKVYHVHLATLPLSILLEEQAHARVQCLARASVKQFRSLQSRRNKCRCQSVTLVRKPVSPQCSSWPKIRSMKSVSFAMVKAEKAWVWQTPQTLWQEESWLLMLPCDDPFWLRFRFVARMSTSCRFGMISQQKYDIAQSFRS